MNRVSFGLDSYSLPNKYISLEEASVRGPRVLDLFACISFVPLGYFSNTHSTSPGLAQSHGRQVATPDSTIHGGGPHVVSLHELGGRCCGGILSRT